MIIFALLLANCRIDKRNTKQKLITLLCVNRIKSSETYRIQKVK